MGSSGKAKILYSQAAPTGGSAGNSVFFLMVIIVKMTACSIPAQPAFPFIFGQSLVGWKWSINVKPLTGEHSHGSPKKPADPHFENQEGR
jgi:hypothetical protein